MAEVHHFAYGWSTPVLAYLSSALGSLLCLVCAARQSGPGRGRVRRLRWSFFGAVALGGGTWLMHFMAVLGFEVVDSPVRFDPTRTMLSLVVVVVGAAVGLGLAGSERSVSTAAGAGRLAAAGCVLGTGLAGMHQLSLAGLRVAGTITYHRPAVAVAVGLAMLTGVVTAVALRAVRGWWPSVATALGLAACACAFHYAGMVELRIRLAPDGGGQIPGYTAIPLILPVIMLTAGALVATALGVLQALTVEEFTSTASAPPGRAGRRRTTALPAGEPSADTTPGHLFRPGSRRRADPTPTIEVGTIRAPLAERRPRWIDESTADHIVGMPAGQRTPPPGAPPLQGAPVQPAPPRPPLGTPTPLGAAVRHHSSTGWPAVRRQAPPRGRRATGGPGQPRP